MHQNELFSILDCVESTNNYAMQLAHAGMAKNGQAWFAHNQWAGKGQRGKNWKSATNKNIILSIAVNPNMFFSAKPFLLSVLVASVCRKWFAEKAGEQTKIKWPNDIYWNANKAGGILIENIYKGKEWKWAIIGIGININQSQFEEDLMQATSLHKITKDLYNQVELAKHLHKVLMQALNNVTEMNLANHYEYYNKQLYKKGEKCWLKQGCIAFETTINLVNEYGQLITEDVIERTFNVGEVEWV